MIRFARLKTTTFELKTDLVDAEKITKKKKKK